jgi:ribosomal protein S18 acetylase RimI-like enzyme
MKSGSDNTFTFHPALIDEHLDALLNGRFFLGNYRPTSSASNSPTFRLARPDDRAALYALTDGSLTPYQFRQHLAQLLRWQAQKRCCWLVVEAMDGGQQTMDDGPWTADGERGLSSVVHRPPSLIGSGQLVCYPHVAELANLSVAPAWRGQGWGSKLIEVLTAVAHYWHIPYLEIVVDAENGRALALYQRLDFVEERRLFLPDGRTAIILGKEITNYE